MSSQTTTHAAKAPAKGAAKASSGTYISLMALVMMNVTIIGSVANDVQQAYYGLSSVTLFIIGALVFFLPTGLVAAELASGWGQRGGIFRWVGEAMGPGLAFTCLLILWFQTSINFGMGVASASATIGFYTPDWDWAVQFMNHPENQFFIILAWLAYYWGLTFLSTKGVKAFARLTKYGVIIGTFIPLAFIVIFTVVWLAQGNVSNVTPTPEAFNPFADGFSLTNLALAAGVFFSFAGIDMNAAHIKQLKKPQKEFPLSIFIAMILTLIIFIAGTVCIAIVTPKSDMNLVYGLYQTYKILGATFNCPWIYVAFVWVGLGASMARHQHGRSLVHARPGRTLRLFAEGAAELQQARHAEPPYVPADDVHDPHCLPVLPHSEHRGLRRAHHPSHHHPLHDVLRAHVRLVPEAAPRPAEPSAPVQGARR